MPPKKRKMSISPSGTTNEEISNDPMTTPYESHHDDKVMEMERRTLIHFGLTREEERSLAAEDVDIYYAGNLVMPGDEGEEDKDMSQYRYLLNDLYVQDYHQFLQYLLKKIPVLTDSSLPSDNVIESIKNLQMNKQTSRVAGEPQQIAELFKGKLVLCIDNRIDIEGSIRSELSDRQKKVMAATEDSLPVEEDCFRNEEVELERRRRKQPDVEKPAYRDSQRFLAESLLERIKLIQKEIKENELEQLYDQFCFQIYTPRAKMLESQTKTRVMAADAECFGPEVYKDPKKLFDAAEKCVQILQTHTGSRKLTKPEKRHRELLDEAKKNPRTFFLIIADEAHWGPTSQASPDENNDCNNDEDDGSSPEGKKEKSYRAYSKLVNSWTHEENPNVFVLLVSATPYNLLTKNTRLDLTKMCVTEVNDGKRELRLATESDATKKQVGLHHMKWEELIDYDIQHGLCNVLMIPLKKYNRLLHVDEEGIMKAEKREKKQFTEVHFKGPSSNDVHIYIIRNGKEESLVVCEDLSKKRTCPEVKFIPSEELCLYESRLYTFKVTPHGMDIFHLETSDGKYMIDREEVGYGENVTVTFCATTKSTDKHINRKDCFFVYKKQPENALEPIDEYTSLNFYFNSLAEEETFNAFLRNDSHFDKMADRILHENKLSRWDMNDILTAEYAIHMVHVFEIRECKLVKNDLTHVLSAMHSACGNYTEKRDKLILQFEEELQQKCKSGDTNLKWIDPALFKAVLHHLEERSKDSLRDSLQRFLYPDGHENKDTDIHVCSYLVECLLFLRKSALDDFQAEIEKTLGSDKRYNDVFKMFSGFDFEEQKVLRVQENETCRLIEDLVLAKDNKPLHGSMKIVRMSTESGNKMYATLCLARKIASTKTHFTFEIVRDFDKFEIKHVQKKPDSSAYRIHQVLQCRDCTHIDKTTFERCLCTDRDQDQDDLKCLGCGHMHTTVKDYVDLKDLPCLVILVMKGRMGDTFPDNFNAMDLRVSTKDLKQPTLTPLVQEFGRLCCYGKKDDPGKIPYILLGKKLAETLVNKRENYATLFGGFDERYKDAYIESGNKAKETHVDYQNTYKHRNRILLEAEPQIGKTGVYLCLVSLLRKAIEGQQEEKQEEFEEIDEEDTETNEVCKNIEAADWMRPFWQEMDKKHPVLKKKLTTGKYAPLFGPYVFGRRPEKIVGTGDTPTNHRKAVITSEGVSTKFRTFSKNAPLTRPDAGCARKDYLIRVAGVENKISVPMQLRFFPLLIKLDSDEELLKRRKRIHEQSTDKDQQQLLTWIFTPSYGRCRRAYLNYDQTMLDSNGSQVEYVHVIVVRPAEYDSYVREWGLSHAVICLPLSLPEVEGVGTEGGGVGYARLFIQLMAQEYRLPAVFMLDDTIHSVRQIKTGFQDDKQVVTTEDGKHSFVTIPLYACLKDLELQLHGKDENPPKDAGTFDAYPQDNIPYGTQESFTGPWEKYGIIGVLRESPYVYSYKNPFRRTHVTAATLVNIKALSAKNLKYKPWQVWEDLHMNNQCDNAGLWVVKYNKYLIRKVCLGNWLPKYFEWTDITQMSKEPAPAKETNCLLALKKYICHYCPIKKMETVASEETALCQDVRQLTESLPEQNQGYHLVVVNDEETAITNIQESVGKAFSVNDGKVALVLPSRVCLNYNLTRKNEFRMTLKECIDSEFLFDCITSEDVGEKSVALVLVHIQGAIAQQNVEDPGEQGTVTISNQEPKVQPDLEQVLALLEALQKQVEALQKQYEAQQKQIEAQQKQNEAQQKQITKLQADVELLQKSGDTPPVGPQRGGGAGHLPTSVPGKPPGGPLHMPSTDSDGGSHTKGNLKNKDKELFSLRGHLPEGLDNPQRFDQLMGALSRLQTVHLQRRPPTPHASNIQLHVQFLCDRSAMNIDSFDALRNYDAAIREKANLGGAMAFVRGDSDLIAQLLS